MREGFLTITHKYYKGDLSYDNVSKTPDMVTKDSSNLLNPNDILKNIRISDVNRLIIAQLNINSLKAGTHLRRRSHSHRIHRSHRSQKS